VDEWFIRMGEKLAKPLEELTYEDKKRNLRHQILDSAFQVKWIPEFGLSQEINWLQNMEDWMISKKRYWGLALPIWECSKCGTFEVIGSEEELRDRAVEGWEVFNEHTPHRPWIDAVKLECSKCGALVSRIPDVGNPWLDAGIVAFSTLDYRHNREHWKKWFPAELVVESLPGQFRNWFYAMLAMSTLLEGRAPFKTCFGHGDVLGEDGREMHKSWGNAIWFDDAVERAGADVMRWMYCSSRPESNLLFGYGKAEEVKKGFLIPLWNIYSFFVTYANIDEWRPPTLPRGSLSLLDRWILSKLNILIRNTTNQLDEYRPLEATVSLTKFINELSTWYLRRSRRRFWKSEKDEEKDSAYATLYTCLINLTKLLAPFVPFMTEEIYQNLVRSVNPSSEESVHHTDWPAPDLTMIDKELMTNMDLAINICELGRAARTKAGIRLRQPLSEVKIVAQKSILGRLEEIEDIIMEELNVKAVSLGTNRAELEEVVMNIKPERLGRRYGNLLPRIRAIITTMDCREIRSNLLEGSTVKIDIDGCTVEFQSTDVDISTRSAKGYSLAEKDNVLVGVNTITTKELEHEGLARDIVRRIQSQRKEAGFNIADNIKIYFVADQEIKEIFNEFGEYIASETLAISILEGEAPNEAYRAAYKIGGKSLRVGLISTKVT
jgi:isoleucyl-tRNA synthetase